MEIAIDSMGASLNADALASTDFKHFCIASRCPIDPQANRCSSNCDEARRAGCHLRVCVSHFNGRFVLSVSEQMLTADECRVIHGAGGRQAQLQRANAATVLHC